MKFDTDFALKLNAYSVGAIGAALTFAPQKTNKLMYTTEHTLNGTGARHFGITTMAAAGYLCAMSQAKDDQLKKNVLIATAAAHTGCVVVSALGMKKKHETKKGAVAHMASNAVCAGICVAAACKKQAKSL